jgi:maltose O-acetyltransferase
VTTPERPAGERTMRERMLAGELYLTDDPVLADEQARAARLLDRFNQSGVDDGAERLGLLLELLGELGEGSEIKPPLRCDYGSRIRVGARTFVNYGLVALDVASIEIGDDVQIGPNVQLLTPTHPIDADTRRAKWEAAEPIVIETNVWLGGGVIVLPGVTIRENTVVGAGSIVTKDLAPNVVAAGNPARVVRSL